VCNPCRKPLDSAVSIDTTKIRSPNPRPAMSEPHFRHLKSRVEQGVLVLTLTEAQLQDEKIAESLLHELMTAVDQAATGKVVIDFSHLKYLSSVAFRPLLNLRRKLQ